MFLLLSVFDPCISPFSYQAECRHADRLRRGAHEAQTAFLLLPFLCSLSLRLNTTGAVIQCSKLPPLNSPPPKKPTPPQKKNNGHILACLMFRIKMQNLWFVVFRHTLTVLAFYSQNHECAQRLLNSMFVICVCI